MNEEILTKEDIEKIIEYAFLPLPSKPMGYSPYCVKMSVYYTIRNLYGVAQLWYEKAVIEEENASYNVTITRFRRKFDSVLRGKVRKIAKEYGITIEEARAIIEEIYAGLYEYVYRIYLERLKDRAKRLVDKLYKKLVTEWRYKVFRGAKPEEILKVKV